MGVARDAGSYGLDTVPFMNNASDGLTANRP
jgi:hypothetical protein